MTEASRLLTRVLTLVTGTGNRIEDLVCAVDEVVSPELADGFLLLLPSVSPNQLELIPATSPVDNPAAYTGLPQCALGLLKDGKEGLLSQDRARCVKYGSMEEGAFRTLDWRSIVFCPLVSPGRSPGAMFFWRNPESSDFTDHEAAVLEKFARLCAPLPLSMAYIAQSLFDQDLAGHLDEAVVVVNHELRVLRWNPAAERLYGIPGEMAIGSHLGTLYNTYYDDPAMDRDTAWAQLQATGEWQGYVTQQSSANKTVSVHSTVTAITDENGTFRGAVAINRDNSELVLARSRIRVTEGLLAAALDAAGAMAVVLDDVGVIIAANREWLDKALSAGARMDRVGLGANYLHSLRRAASEGEADAISALASIDAVLSGQIDHTSAEYQMECENGQVWYQVDVRSIGCPAGAVITHREVTAHRRLERDLARYDTHDPLTGLGNRHLLEQRITARNGVVTHPGLIVFDVDGFATINEALGHSCGDEVLCRLADQFRELCPPGYSAYRLGGDQFAVFAAVTTPESLNATAAAIIEEIGRPLTVSGHEIRLTFSVGIVNTGARQEPDPSRQASALISQADAARLESKVLGRNRVQNYRPDLQPRPGTLTLPSQFLTDLGTGRIHMYYQEIRRLHDDTVTGFEGLLRWDRSGVGMLAAGAFASLLGAPLVAGPLATWGVRTVTADAVRLIAEHPQRHIHLGLNISAQQFLDVDVAAALESAISRAQIPHETIVVEVTESTTFTDDLRVLGQLQRMHDFGISIALDDFGTGFSSLQHLRSLPVDAVKVDRSFTAGIGSDTAAEALVRALIGLAHDLELSVVAEGVESEEQRDWLLQAGCDFYQGYLAHRPASLDDCSRALSGGEH